MAYQLLAAAMSASDTRFMMATVQRMASSLLADAAEYNGQDDYIHDILGSSRCCVVESLLSNSEDSWEKKHMEILDCSLLPKARWLHAVQ